MISVRPFEDGDAQDLADVMMEMVAFYGSSLAVEGSVSEDIIRQSKNIDIVVALSMIGLPGSLPMASSTRSLACDRSPTYNRFMLHLPTVAWASRKS
jgi:hypothetical protein